MNHYLIWCNLKETCQDLQFAENVHAYMEFLKSKGCIEGYGLTRKKLGFGPASLGEFQISIEVTDMTQLEAAFQEAATRGGEVQRLHSSVYQMVTDFQAALYRDFPDPARVG
jgi:hypothetical protein